MLVVSQRLSSQIQQRKGAKYFQLEFKALIVLETGWHFSVSLEISSTSLDYAMLGNQVLLGGNNASFRKKLKKIFETIHSIPSFKVSQ